jgi:solute carrier family 13 (sodium-dependent dicarboxylate transporter), member 2/3/5
MTLNTKKLIYLLLGMLVLVVGIWLLTPELVVVGHGTAVVLSVQGKAALAVLAMAVFLWMTETLPFAVTGLLSVCMAAVTGAGDFKELMQEGFGNDIILFLIGLMIFSAAINETGLLERFTTYRPTFKYLTWGIVRGLRDNLH